MTIGFLLGLLILLVIRTQQIADEPYATGLHMPPLYYAAQQMIGGTMIWLIIYVFALLIYLPFTALALVLANRCGAFDANAAALAGVTAYLPWTVVLAYVSIERGASWFAIRTLVTGIACLGAGAICGLSYFGAVSNRSNGPVEYR